MILPEITKQLFDAFAGANEELYFVGGIVRDYCIHQMACDPAITEHPLTTPFVAKKDIDFATSAHPTKTIKILEEMKLPVHRIGEEFGTIGTRIKDWPIEITTYRCAESYKKGSRKPSVIFGTTIEGDLSRRDFTVNAMAMDGNGKLFDPHGGHGALIQGLLLTPAEDPSESFADDPLRMLRAYRFECQLGCSLMAVDAAAIESGKGLIHEISKERIFDEMTKLLMTRKPSYGLKHMGEIGLLGEIFPELQKCIDFKQNQGKYHSKLVWPHILDVVDNSPAIKEVRWAALFHDVCKPQTYSETETGVHFYTHEPKGAYVWNSIADRLKVSTAFKEEVHHLIYHHLRFAQLGNANATKLKVGKPALRRFIKDCGSYMENLYQLSLADITSHHPNVVQEKRARCMELKRMIDEINAECNVLALKLPKGLGKEVASALDMPHGPELGRIMKHLQDQLVMGNLDEQSDFIEAAKLYKKRDDGIKELVHLSEEMGLYEHQQEESKN